VFPEWAASDDPDSGTFVATLPPEAVAESDAVAERDDRAEGDTLVEGRRRGRGRGGRAGGRGRLYPRRSALRVGGVGAGDPRRPRGPRVRRRDRALDDRRARLGPRPRRAGVSKHGVLVEHHHGARAVAGGRLRARDGVPVRGAGAGRVRLDGGSEATPSRPSPIPTRTPRGRSGATATPATTCAGSRSTPTSRGPARRSPAGDWRPRPTRIDCSRSPTPTRSPASRSGLA